MFSARARAFVRYLPNILPRPAALASLGVGAVLIGLLTAGPAFAQNIITGISPTSGPAGTPVTANTTGFFLGPEAREACGPVSGTLTFGPTTVDATLTYSEPFFKPILTAAAPAGTGTVGPTGNVTLAGCGGISTDFTSGGTFTYTVPTVTAISPAGGPAGGGTVVTITGTNLGPATAVKFGVTDAASFTVNNATTITATSPAGIGTVDVTVTTLAVTSETSAADQFVYAQAATSTTLISSRDPSKFGQMVAFTATATTETAGIPTGTVTFMRGATALGTRTLAAGKATFQTGTLPVGAHAITALFDENANFLPSTSSVLTQNVTKGASKTALTSTPKPSKPGKPVTLAAMVTAVAPAKGTPTGTVAFKDGAKALGTKALVNGKATLPTKLAAGTHKLTAAYAGSVSFTPAASPALTHPVKSALSGLAVVKLSDNGFVAAWEARDKERSTIHIRRYPADGRAGKDLPVTASEQDHAEPSVAGLKNGGFVVVWTGQDRSGLGVYGQRYNKAGTKLGAEFRVNASTVNDQSQPSAAALEDGGFVVAWASNQNAEAGFGVYARRYTVAGKAIGGEFKISDTDGNQTYPSAAALEHGGFVVAWQSDEAESSVRAQRYDTAGRKAGVEFAVSAAATDPSIAALDDGGFVIAWTSGTGTGAQRFNANGAKRDGVLKINDPARDQREPTIAAIDDGFVVVWTSQDKDGPGTTLRGQTYEAAGKRLKGAFSADAAPQDRSRPRATGLPGGNFVVLWTTPDGGLREQRFNRNEAD